MTNSYDFVRAGVRLDSLPYIALAVGRLPHGVLGLDGVYFEDAHPVDSAGFGGDSYLRRPTFPGWC